MNIGYIYAIQNNINDCKYIGHSTNNLIIRFASHILQAYCNKKNTKQKYAKLYNFMKEHNPESFRIVLLEIIKYNDKKELKIKENNYIMLHDSINNGYNKNKPILTKLEKKEYKNRMNKLFRQNNPNYFTNYYETHKDVYKNKYYKKSKLLKTN